MVGALISVTANDTNGEYSNALFRRSTKISNKMQDQFANSNTTLPIYNTPRLCIMI